MSGSKSNDPVSVRRQPTGIRPPPGPDIPEQKQKAIPPVDAQSNTMYVARAAGAPNRHSKPAGSMAPNLSMNAPSKAMRDHSLVQRARRR